MIAVLLLLLSLAASAVFAGSETGYYALNQLKLRHFAHTHRGAGILERTVKNPAGFLAMLLVGNNFANAGAATAVNSLLQQAGFGRVELWNTLLLTPIVFLFGEVGPKQFFLSNPMRRTVSVAPFLALARVVLAPITAPLVALTHWLNPEEEDALARHQLTAFLYEGRHGLKRDAEVLAGARRVVESRGRGLQSFLDRRAPLLPATTDRQGVEEALRAAAGGSALVERWGAPPALCRSVDLVRAPDEAPLEDLLHELPVLQPEMDLADAFGNLRQLGASRALVGRPGAWEGLFDLEHALGLLLAPETLSEARHV